MVDANAPLLWEHEDGRSGLEVSAIPHQGMVFFYDAQGPVYRLDNIEEARWWVVTKILLRDGSEHRFRVTMLRKGGVARYILPGELPGVVLCEGEEHSGCQYGLCVVADGILNERVKAVA